MNLVSVLSVHLQKESGVRRRLCMLSRIGFPGPLGEILGLLRMIPRLVGWEVFSWMPLRLAASWVKLFAPQSWLMVKSK